MQHCQVINLASEVCETLKEVRKEGGRLATSAGTLIQLIGQNFG